MENLLEHVNEEQLAAVMHTDGPLMIIAGAGTGKTTVITHRIAWLIEQGHAKPDNILALTFTDKASAEMEERVDVLLPYGYVDLQISTFHSFCETLLRDYGVDMGLSRDFKLVNELDAWLLARKHFDKFELDYYRPLGNPTKYIRSLLTHFSRAKDEMITPDNYLEYAKKVETNLDAANTDEDTLTEIARLTELANAYHTYQQVLSENDCLDFGDLVMYALQLLQKRPKVLKEVRERFTHILVDEFQDTNWAQYELVKLISAPNNNLTVVGDDDQSIYKFRGASLSNILQFETDYPTCKRIVLTKNYRSVQSILDKAYDFIQMNNPNRLEGRIQKNQEPLSKKLFSQRETTGLVEHMHFNSLDDETRNITNKILDLRKEFPDTNWSDFAILVRANNSANDFIATLERYKIPYQFMALRGLYTKSIILDLLAYLHVIDNPYDSPSFYRILTHRMFDFPSHDIVTINHEAHKKGKSLYEVCRSLNGIPGLDVQTVARAESLLSTLESLSEQAKTRRASEMIVIIMKETGLIEYVNSLTDQQQRDDFRYLHQFYDRVKRFDEQNDGSHLHEFVQEFAHERDAGEEGSLRADVETGPDVVQIMTIHASKGLEFRFVFVVNMVDRRFPSSKRRDPIQLPDALIKEAPTDGDMHLEEERRLFYVAMTRAKDHLYLTSAEDYGGVRKKKMSRFLHELGIEKPTFSEETAVGPFEEEVHVKTGSDSTPLVINLPKQYSFTQLAAFKTCPLQYKFAHILKVPVFGKWTLSYGKTMHNTLQKWFELWLERSGTELAVDEKKDESIPVTEKELLQFYEESWMDDWYPNDRLREEYRAKGKDSLIAYRKSVADNIPNPLSLEQGFTLKIKDISLKGRIDRIDIIDGGIEIIDYKTGNPKTEKKLTKDDRKQLLLYQIAAIEVLELKPVKLTFHYLEDNSQVSFLGTDEDLEKLKLEIIEQVGKLKSTNFKATPGFHCQFCDFADICEFRAKK